MGSDGPGGDGDGVGGGGVGGGGGGGGGGGEGPEAMEIFTHSWKPKFGPCGSGSHGASVSECALAAPVMHVPVADDTSLEWLAFSARSSHRCCAAVLLHSTMQRHWCLTLVQSQADALAVTQLPLCLPTSSPPSDESLHASFAMFGADVAMHSYLLRAFHHLDQQSASHNRARTYH